MNSPSKNKKDLLATFETQEIEAIPFGNKITSPNALTPEEIMNLNKTDNTDAYNNEGALESLKKRIHSVTNAPENTKEDLKTTQDRDKTPPANQEITEEKKSSLSDKCMPFFIDDKGNDTSVNQEPLYKLQSVAEILENDSKKALERLSEKYGIAFNSLDINSSKTEKETPAPKNTEDDKTISFDNEILSINREVKNLQTNLPYIISDIDNSTVLSKKESDDTDNETITFTPVMDKNTYSTKLNISTQTKPIDIIPDLTYETGDVYSENNDTPSLENNDFDDYIPKEEFAAGSSPQPLINKFFRKKRNTFLISTFTIFITFLIALSKLPIFSELILSETFVSMIVFTGLMLIEILLNIDMFKSVAKILTKKCEPDIFAVTASVFTLAYSIVGIINEEIITDMILLVSIILSVRALSLFWRNSYMQSNFKQILTSGDKTAVKLINDPAITFSMARGSIDGDILIATPNKTENIRDFMKYSTYNEILNGKISLILVLSVIASVIFGLISGAYYENLLSALYSAAAIQCFCAIPTLFLIDNLSLYRASKKLNKFGAMIAGKKGAEELEMANAVVVNSSDIFPEGTVTLHQMKVLSENNLDDTLIKAAALTQYINSPLAPMFKSIIKSGNITVLPDTDTVKYEDKMGVSGWVDNNLLIIGNRTLIESRGIDIPSVEFDRKILRKGFFPVYVATENKACAVLIVQYNVDLIVARDLQYLSKIGVTLLINNADPNLTEEMICDYIGLYEDSVKIMSSVGTHIYKSNNTKTESISSPAVLKSDLKVLPKLLCCANKIKRVNSLLSILYFMLVSIGIVLFGYTSFGNSGEIISQTALLIYTVVTTVISYLLYLTQRP